MSVDQLTEEQKLALAHLLVEVALADGLLRVPEVEYIASFRERHKLGEDPFENPLPPEKACLVFGDHSSRVTALHEMVRIACVDGEFDLSERAEIQRITEFLRLPQKMIQEVENRIAEGRELSC